MSRLLALPREIRDMIIADVLQNRPVPYDNNDLTIPRKPVHTWEYLKSVGLAPLMFEDCAFEPSSLPLLLTNRQLRDEAVEEIKLLPGKGKNFTLDVMFVEERELWATWACVPTYTKTIEHLEANVRIVGAMKEFGGGYGHKNRSDTPRSRPRSSSDSRSIWDIGNGAPPAVVWPFYSLLEHVCRVGACSPLLNRVAESSSYYQPIYDESEPRIAIKNLVISFSTVADEVHLAGIDDEDDWFRARRRWDRQEGMEEMQNKVMRPEWLAEYLLDFLGNLLSMSYHMSTYGAFLYNSLDSITIKVGDEVIQVFDLGSKLAKLGFNESFGNISRDDRQEYFNSWKERTIALRRKKGLKIQ